MLLNGDSSTFFDFFDCRRFHLSIYWTEGDWKKLFFLLGFVMTRLMNIGLRFLFIAEGFGFGFMLTSLFLCCDILKFIVNRFELPIPS